MTAHFEDLVREAQERFAERAVHPDRIRAALPRRAARRARQRRYGVLGLAAVAAGAAVAVAVPVLALRGGSGGAGAQQLGAPPPASAPASHAPVSTDVALRYRPGWLPAGLAERIRDVPFGAAAAKQFAATMRTWTLSPVGTSGNGGGARLDLTVRHPADAGDPAVNQGTPVSINGTTGYYHGVVGGDAKSYVEWRAAPDAVVSIDQHGLHLSESDMLRIARSVQPDTARFQAPLRLGWLPDGLALGQGELGGDSATSWYARVTAEAPVSTPPSGAPAKESKDAPLGVEVDLAPTTNAPSGGERLTVGGHPARLVTRTDLPGVNMKYLVVTLGGGQLLTVTGEWPDAQPLTQADFVRIAENATTVGTVDRSWIGR